MTRAAASARGRADRSGTRRSGTRRAVAHRPGTRSSRGPRGAAALAVLALLAGCTAPAPQEPQPSPSGTAAAPIRIATGPTDQTAVLAHVYAERLRSAGFEASVEDTGEDPAGHLAALERGEVRLAADYSGHLYLRLRSQQVPVPGATPTAAPDATPSAAPTDPAPEGGLAANLSELLGLGDARADDDDVLAGVREVLPGHLRVLAPAPAENRVAVVVTRPTAVELELSDLEDLAPECAQLVLGTDRAFVARPEGREGLADAYGCTPERVAPYGSTEELVGALLADEVGAAALFTASPEIEDNALVVLGDPLDVFVPQQVVPVAARDLPDEAVRVVDEVSAAVDTEDLVLMTRMTTAQDPYTPEETAQYWLREERD
ncbi:glycine betaine ABC transporter substrate-binding protein [Kocuria flava]|uniref:glycine betaine ABC transporter substrate-binding protein n=1 Tax=Kocuria flava TaxID=446860 RepID=UPI00248528A1|nr:glycine betaine ABC transporter substrate-binding protein [Kocuria flava]